MAFTILPPLPDNDIQQSIPIASSDDDSDSQSDGGMSVGSDRPRKRLKVGTSLKGKDMVVPGEPITSETQWMRGHGTTTLLTPVAQTSTLITATLAGPLRPTNKLLSVAPIRARYTPEVGDLVIGRIVSVEKNRWKVNVAAPLLASLSMSSINLPGGALRRRTANDELQMRQYFQEGDLLVAEVQQISGGDGSATLHARSLRYGKLRNGTFLAVSGTGGGGGVVRSRRQQFTVNTGAQGGGDVRVILGVNGYIWLAKHIEAVTGSGKAADASKSSSAGAGGVDLSISNLDEAVSAEAYSSQNDMIEEGTRREISRLCEIIKALTEASVRIDEETVRRGYEVAVDINLTQEAGVEETGGRELLDHDTRKRIVAGVLTG